MGATYFITGTGTGIGKTVVSAILTEALEADYWKPVQAGFEDGTDPGWIQSVISNSKSVIHPEVYKLKLPASPHISASQEGITISLDTIQQQFEKYRAIGSNLIIEGAGGLLVPLNEKEFVIDLVKKLGVKVILVSRNYLGSINHSLLTAQVCQQHKIPVAGWIFNDLYMHYEEEIVHWSGYPKIASVGKLEIINREMIKTEADQLKKSLDQLT
jgi:dethiobiotin synthetase